MSNIPKFRSGGDYWDWAILQYCIRWQKTIRDIKFAECVGPACLLSAAVNKRNPGCDKFWGNRNG